MLARTLLLASAAALMLAGSGCSGGQARAMRNQQSLKKIVAAIRQYRADHKQYPDVLERLTPRYLSQIPPPEGPGMKWTYRLTDGGSQFDLTFYAPGDDWAGGYFSASDRYWFDDK
jgi:hypothetical protein